MNQTNVDKSDQEGLEKADLQDDLITAIQKLILQLRDNTTHITEKNRCDVSAHRNPT